jgi:GTP-binding protein
LINHFQLRNGAFLVDLPGYGYAQVPTPIRAHWGRVLGDYLQTRTSLIGLVLIMDSRHPLKDLDWQMVEWFAPTGKPIHILLTKADKLSNQVATQTLRNVQAAVKEHPQISVQLFSSLKKSGVEEAERVVSLWLEQNKVPISGLEEINRTDINEV